MIYDVKQHFNDIWFSNSIQDCGHVDICTNINYVNDFDIPGKKIDKIYKIESWNSDEKTENKDDDDYYYSNSNSNHHHNNNHLHKKFEFISKRELQIKPRQEMVMHNYKEKILLKKNLYLSHSRLNINLK